MKFVGAGGAWSDEYVVRLTSEELVLVVGGLREALEEVEDWEFSIRLGADKREMRELLSEVHALYRNRSAVAAVVDRDSSAEEQAIESRVPGFRLRLASHGGQRDGTSLELRRDDGAWVAEVFEDGLTRQRVVNYYESDIPLVAVDWMLEEARRRL